METLEIIDEIIFTFENFIANKGFVSKKLINSEKWLTDIQKYRFRNALIFPFKQRDVIDNGFKECSLDCSDLDDVIYYINAAFVNVLTSKDIHISSNDLDELRPEIINILEKYNILADKYSFILLINEFACNGLISVLARDEDDAYQKAMELVGEKLAYAFPELDIMYNVELAATY